MRTMMKMKMMTKTDEDADDAVDDANNDKDADDEDDDGDNDDDQVESDDDDKADADDYVDDRFPKIPFPFFEALK